MKIHMLKPFPDQAWQSIALTVHLKEMVIYKRKRFMISFQSQILHNLIRTMSGCCLPNSIIHGNDMIQVF